jgi:hypothetical protein
MITWNVTKGGMAWAEVGKAPVVLILRVWSSGMWVVDLNGEGRRSGRAWNEEDAKRECKMAAYNVASDIAVEATTAARALAATGED